MVTLKCRRITSVAKLFVAFFLGGGGGGGEGDYRLRICNFVSRIDSRPRFVTRVPK